MDCLIQRWEKFAEVIFTSGGHGSHGFTCRVDIAKDALRSASVMPDCFLVLYEEPDEKYYHGTRANM